MSIENAHLFLPHYAVSAIPAEFRQEYLGVIGQMFIDRPEFYPGEALKDERFYQSVHRIGHVFCQHMRANIDRRNDLADLEPIRRGSVYGGWWFLPELLGPDSVVYGCGVGADTTWDEALIEEFGCDVFGFDPTPPGVKHGRRVSEKQPKFHLVEVGVWSEDTDVVFHPPPSGAGSMSLDNIHGTAGSFEAPVRRISTIMEARGHTRLDLIKLDIEGAAHAVIDDFLKAGVRPVQVLFETDMPVPPWTLEASFKSLMAAGYSCYQVDGLNFSFVSAEGLAEARKRKGGSAGAAA